jgi:hypothetical protein
MGLQGLLFTITIRKERQYTMPHKTTLLFHCQTNFAIFTKSIYFTHILQNLEQRRVVSIELITPYSNRFQKENLLAFIQKYPRVHQFVLHTAPTNELAYVNASGMGHIIFI